MVFEKINLNKEQLERVEDFRNDFEKLYEDIKQNVFIDSREKSIALTKLEESNMWLNKAISREEE